MNIKTFMAVAVVALTAACASENSEVSPAPEATEELVVEEATGGPCGDGRELGENEVCQ